MASIENKKSKQSQIERSVRKRRILMKEKCHFIDHEISLNLEKLDSLLSLVKSKKQQFESLNGIVEALIEDEIDSKSRKDVRKLRRLKFKYSIHRDYSFESNPSTQFTTNDKVVETKDGIKFIESLNLQDSMLIERLNFEENLEPETVGNGTDVSMSAQLLENRSSRLQRFKSLRESEIDDEEHQIQSIHIETRYNWIQRYLNHQLNDTIVKAFNTNEQQIELIKFNKKEEQFQCNIIQENQVFVMNNMTNRSVKSSKKQKFVTEEYLDYKYKDFINENASVQIDFPRHTCQVKLFQPEKQEVIRLSLLEKDSSIRILLKSQNSNTSQMQRIMIFKEIKNQNLGQKYKIVWTKYDKESFIEDIILEGDCNYLITNLCCNPSSELKLILNPSDLSALKIQKTQYDPWRSYNMLCSAFEECSKVFMSQNIYDEQKPLEYLRANHLDHGLVLEIYQNIHSQAISFIDNRQQKRSQEDISLLFGEIYIQNQGNNVYEPDELVIKFFEVTEKPARLYYPEKKVLIGNQISEQVTVYSTFK